MTAIDLGSNTIRFIEYSKEKAKFTKEWESVVRTADGMNLSSGLISKEAVQRVINAIKKAQKDLDFTQTIAVATAAMRNGENSKDVLEEIYKNTGVKFQIISGELEGKLTALAVKKEGEKFSNFPLVINDIGGASTEIIQWEKEFICKSLDLGIVTSSKRFSNTNELISYLDSLAPFFEKFLNKIETPFVIGSTAGTPTILAALKHNLTYQTYDKNIISGTKLTLKEIEYLEKDLLKNRENLTHIVGKGREDLIMIGVVIFKKIIQFLGKNETLVFDSSLREGVILGRLKGII